jgi:hypothetical protein
MATRIKETGEGDREFVQPSVPGVAPGGQRHPSVISEDDLLTCLHALANRGLISCAVQSLVWSTTEYVCEWTVRDGKQSQG